MSGNSLELRKFVAPEFIYGTGALSLTGRYAQNLGARKALVVTDPGVIENGWADKVCESLRKEGISTTVFSDITPNPKDYEVEAGCNVYDKYRCDIIVAIGGGSPIDCAKAIGIAHANNCSVLDFEGVDEVPTARSSAGLHSHHRRQLGRCLSIRHHHRLSPTIKNCNCQQNGGP